MKVKLESGVEYWVSWIHNNTLQEKDKKMDQGIKSNDGSYTECYIENKTNPTIKGIGYALLGKKEKQFNKDIGRKISLVQAMKDIGLNKKTRTLFWNEYHKLTNKSQRIIEKYQYSDIPKVNYKLLNKSELDHLNIR